MKSREIEKNCLDLEYRKQLQIMNALVILATTGMISFTGTFIWKRELLLIGSFLTFGILMACLLVYQRVNRRLKEIIDSIRSLKEV
ncbi:MAG: hypothetical protein AABX86_03225 [Nanoarchaeota archaeon]